MLDLRIRIAHVEPVTRPIIFRVKHDAEMGELWRTQLPQVHPLFPNQFSPVGEGWQRLIKALNPRISADRCTNCCGDETWGYNGQGFGNDNDPRANYMTGENLPPPGVEPNLPRHELLTCGGSLLTGHVEGYVLIVDVLDWRDVPTLAWLEAHPWYITQVTRCGLTGDPVPLLQSKDASGTPIPFRHPLIGDRVRYPRITIPISKLQKWDAAELPDAYKRYI